MGPLCPTPDFHSNLLPGQGYPATPKYLKHGLDEPPCVSAYHTFHTCSYTLRLLGGDLSHVREASLNSGITGNLRCPRIKKKKERYTCWVSQRRAQESHPGPMVTPDTGSFIVLYSKSWLISHHPVDLVSLYLRLHGSHSTLHAFSIAFSYS